MSLPSPEPDALSRPQRHCHLLLLLFLTEYPVSVDLVCKINRVDRPVTRQDIAEVEAEIQRYHRLGLQQNAAGIWRISGTELDQRLCLMHWLRRALRLTPDFVQQHFAPHIKRQLKNKQIDKALYDERNLLALAQHCAQRLAHNFSERDCQFLQLFLQHSLYRQARTTYNDAQQAWLADRVEHQVAKEVIRHWQKRGKTAPDSGETWLIALLFSRMHAANAHHICQDYEHRLLQNIHQLIERFQTISGMRFSDEKNLADQLYTHLAQAIERALFGVGIDSSLTEDVSHLYPKLLRTTQAALAEFERHYSLSFSMEEMGLIAILFGAWLMQESVLQEKQVLLLTGKDRQLEREVEQQVRELTLLPLTIKYLDVAEFQHNSAPKGIALVITPYATPLPLYSPPLIHAELPLKPQQQQRIRLLLET